MILAPKYRNRPIYHQVRELLITAARNGQLVHYISIFNLMGLPTGNHASKEAGYLLGEISEDENDQGRPMLNAIAVKKSTGKPGKGFFYFAQQLGKLPSNATEEQKERFRELERDAVFACDWN